MLEFVLAGAPKCGTTSIATALASTPGICLSRPKETFFFNPEFAAKHIISDYGSYEALFSGHGLRGDGSIWSMYSPTFPERLLEIAPEAKVVLSLRSPERMVASLYHYNLDKSYEDAADIETALELEVSRRQGGCIPRACPEPHYLHYRRVADYTPAVERILEQIPPERVMIFDFDAADKCQILPEICAFLGVEIPAQVDLPHDNPTSYAGNTVKYDLLRQASRAIRWMRNNSPVPLPATGAIDRFRRKSRDANRDVLIRSKEVAQENLQDEIFRYRHLISNYGRPILQGEV